MRLEKQKMNEAAEMEKRLEEEKKRKKAEYEALTPAQKRASDMFDESIARIYKEFEDKGAFEPKKKPKSEIKPEKN